MTVSQIATMISLASGGNAAQQLVHTGFVGLLRVLGAVLPDSPQNRETIAGLIQTMDSIKSQLS